MDLPVAEHSANIVVESNWYVDKGATSVNKYLGDIV